MRGGGRWKCWSKDAASGQRGGVKLTMIWSVKNWTPKNNFLQMILGA
jgi:hypothetical protein